MAVGVASLPLRENRATFGAGWVGHAIHHDVRGMTHQKNEVTTMPMRRN